MKSPLPESIRKRLQRMAKRAAEGNGIIVYEHQGRACWAINTDARKQWVFRRVTPADIIGIFCGPEAEMFTLLFEELESSNLL